MDEHLSQSRSQWPFGYEEFTHSVHQAPGPTRAPIPAPGQTILDGHEQEAFTSWIQTVGSDLQPADEELLCSPAGLNVVDGSNSTLREELLRYEGFQSYGPSSFETGVPSHGYYHAAKDDLTIAPSTIFNAVPRHLSPASASYSNLSMLQPTPDDATHTPFEFGQRSNYSCHPYQLPIEVQIPHGYYQRDLRNVPAGCNLPTSEPSSAHMEPPSALATRFQPSLTHDPALHFGSDRNFGQRSYIVPHDQHPTLSTQNSLLQQLSPVGNDSETNDAQEIDLASSQDRHQSSQHIGLDTLPQEASNIKTDRRDQAKHRRKSVTPGSEQGPIEPPPSSRPQNAKKKVKERVCLTDEQKRNNHKKSEQNRRDLINHWQEEMEALVPGINDKKMYKAGKLELAVRWLESIYEDNNRMAAYLKQLG
ncbi:MAG: hypothetical protein Q9220_005119 [cf. Caloplaca sp. 1 TL-2023]